MKKLFYLLIALTVIMACTRNEPDETAYSSFLYNHVPMPMDTAQSLKYQWAQKEVLSSILIDGMESLENWEVVNEQSGEDVASFSLSNEKVFEGKSSIKFVCPTTKPVQIPIGGRYWGREKLTLHIDSADLSEYNRISIEIFPDFEGFRQLYLTMILDTDDKLSAKLGKANWHTVQLINHQWNKLIMEVPHIPLDKVTGISISYGLQGNEPDAADTIVWYADNLQMQKVETDYFEGWGTDDAISFTHSGYNTNSKKTAFTSLDEGEQFRVVDLGSNNTILEKSAEKQTSYIGTFSVFDFSEIKAPGRYKIVYGDVESESFPINEDVWLPSLEKTINTLYVLRCGYEIPGIHLKCHTDWYTVFKGDTIEMSGGWHDAGDLSQRLRRTASTTGILFKLSRKYQKTDERLANRLIEEALWGLKWVHKNRFDGLSVIYRTVHDHYSDGIIGNFDDTPVKPATSVSVSEHYHAVIANVEASMTLKNTHPELAEKSKQYAIDDWELLVKNDTRWTSASLSIAISAGSRLFELTGSNAIKNQIIDYADSLLTYQQVEPMNWSTPLSGFFYMDKNSDGIFGHAASFPVASPVVGLVDLCKLFPKDDKYPMWFKSVSLHANYLKTIARFTAPYYMIPANVYKLNGTEDDDQILNGMKMDEEHYLRMFPVWGQHRGNNANVLSFGAGLAAANQILNDPEMQSIAQAQLEWVLGKNPFNQSLMYGEGYNFSTQYAVFPGDVTGGLPVGIWSKFDSDIPYWPAAVLHNYKELWIHPSTRWLELLDYLGLK